MTRGIAVCVLTVNAVDLSLCWHKPVVAALSIRPANDTYWPEKLGGPRRSDDSLPEMQSIPQGDDQIQETLQHVYKLADQKQNIKALSILYDLLDGALLLGQFERCNAVLAALDVDRLNPACWVGVLGITASARIRLPGRERICQQIKERLSTREVSPQVHSALRSLM